MDSFRRKLRCSLPLLVGFGLGEVDHGGRLSAVGGVRSLTIVKGDPFCNAGFGLRSGLPSVPIDTFILQGPPQALDEDVVDTAALSVHRDPGPDPLQPVGPGKGREMATLIRIHNLGRAKPIDRLAQRFDAEVDLQRVGDAPGQNFAGKPVHDGHGNPPIFRWVDNCTSGRFFQFHCGCNTADGHVGPLIVACPDNVQNFSHIFRLVRFPLF